MKQILLTIPFAILILLSACSGNTADKSETTSPEKTEQVTDATSGATESYGKVHDLTFSYFKQNVMDLDADVPTVLSERPVVIDFYATWCGPCKEMSPVVEELAKEMAGKVDFMRVDVDKEADLASIFGIQSIPTFVFIATDGAINSEMGKMPKESLRSFIQRYCIEQ